MDPDAELLFYELVDLSPAERESYFARRQVRPHLRAEVESLLGCDSGPGPSLTDRVAGVAEQLLHSGANVREGVLCGPYRPVRLLGQGGMGAVWLAERADGEVTQRVAIKFLRFDADQPAFRDRFLRERQILASLNHPGIARLLDAGHTADGQPYLVMDYVEGTPIDVHAEKLDLRAKLRLFIRVCEAVSYAHRNLIVHRDLKPSNILVDGTGQPRLLDFGIAKILEAGADQTQTRERLLTPDYASPEQVRGTTHNTATDVYSLGAVLYKLLTGRSPHALAEQTPQGIEIAICSREPELPSRVRPGLPRDLDFVVRKALRKEPEERYASADALADDLRAILESHPVRARSGNAWYRARKFLRRYWVPVAAATLTVAGLSVGLFVANRERAIAQRRFLQVRQLANDVIDLEREVRGLSGGTKARNRIVSSSLAYLAALGAEVRADANLALEISAAYLRLAQVQGVPTGSNLGQFAQAEESLVRANEFVESVLAAAPENRRAWLTSAQIAYDRVVLASYQDRHADVVAHARQVAVRLDRLLSLGQPEPNEIKQVVVLQRATEIARSVEAARRDRPSLSKPVAPTLGRPGDLKAAWGYNAFGELGNGNHVNTNIPARLPGLSGVVAVAGGWFHSLALKSDGTVWAWGRNSYGQLGIGSKAGTSKPVRVARLSKVVAIGHGYSHNLAVKADGTVWAWGWNSNGQLGVGHNSDSSVPVQVWGLNKVVAVAAGGAHSLALKSDGTVWAWGYNFTGQLGHGDNKDTKVPVQVTGLSRAVAVAGGGAHSLAVKADGTVWAWSSNLNDQLGNGNNDDGYVPVQVAGLGNVVAVAAGDWYSLALKADGTVCAWGWNGHGELGNGTNTASNMPVAAVGLSDVVAIAAAPNVGPGHSLALRADGTVWGWGYNASGQLGNGSNTDSTVPTQVSGLPGAIGVAAGGLHSLAILAGPSIPIWSRSGPHADSPLTLRRLTASAQ